MKNIVQIYLKIPFDKQRYLIKEPKVVMQNRILLYEKQNFRLSRQIKILEERAGSVQTRLSTFRLKTLKV